jgi:multimeric flavodoxin WrbA
MLIVGLQGSPRKKGNTSYLLSAFMNAAAEQGAKTRMIEVCEKNVQPCRELIVCEKKGYCPIDDDMSREIYELLWEADAVVAATPVFFYSATAQLKALIDRCQTLWSRKYKLKLIDPGRNHRRGYILSVAATKGKNLFDGIHLMAKYFFDAIGAGYAGSLTYREVEKRKDMAEHPSVHEDVKEAAKTLLAPFTHRKKLLFVGRSNTCCSQMAQAFTRYSAGDRLDVDCAGLNPGRALDPAMVEAMHEKGIDMGFRKPRSLDDVHLQEPADLVVHLYSQSSETRFKGVAHTVWPMEDAHGKSIEDMRRIRDDIENRVFRTIDSF